MVEKFSGQPSEPARELLRQQLVKRGITLSAAALATAMAEKVSGSPVAAMLTISTVKAVTCVAVGKAAAVGGMSAFAIALAEEVMKSMAAVKAMIVIVVLAITVGGAGLAAAVGCNPPGPLVDHRCLQGQWQTRPKSKPPHSPSQKSTPLRPLWRSAARRSNGQAWNGALSAGFVDTCSCFPPDGKTLASAGGGGICLLGPNHGKAVCRLECEVPIPGVFARQKMLAATGRGFHLFEPHRARYCAS